MRVALVSPYSWTYPGGVMRHVQALAEQLLGDGHYARVLAPFDPVDRRASRLHRGAWPEPRMLPDYLAPLGRTVGFKANGAVSNLSITPHEITAMLQELRSGRYDVVHIHEPIAPMLGWVAADQVRLPLVGTFHAYSAKPVPNLIANALGVRRVLSRLDVRIAVSPSAAWTGRRWYGGDYRIIPNGVHVDRGEAPPRAHRPDGARLRIVFVGQPVERKGLPVLLRAFDALRSRVPVEMTLIGPTATDLAPHLSEMEGVTALGKVDDRAKQRELARADVLCAPSLGGESFGMVLTEAFAAGTPVVASSIPGYRDVVRDGVDGLLVPPGDASALAVALRDLWAQPRLRAAMGQAAIAGVERFAWPTVAAQILDCYRDAITARGLRARRVPRARPAALPLPAGSEAA